MKYFYFAITTEENGKYYSYAYKATERDNLLNVIKSDKNIIAFNICATRKEAHETVNYWNKTYKNNGTFFLTMRLFFREENNTYDNRNIFQSFKFI